MNSGDSALLRFVRWALHNRSVIFCAWGVVAVLGGVGLLTLRVDTATSSFLDRRSPKWATYERSLARHGSDEFMVAAVEGAERDPSVAMELVATLGAEVAIVDGVQRVDSLASVPMVRADPGGTGLVLAPLVAVPSSDPVIEAAVGWARSDAMSSGLLVSADGRTFAVNVVLDENVGGERLGTVDEVLGIVGRHGLRVTGVPVFRTQVNVRTQREVLLLAPATLLVISLGLLVAFRRVGLVVAVLAGPAVAVVGMLGAMGLFQVPLSLSTMILPSILLALGCAYAAHLLVAAAGLPTHDERLEAQLGVARPVALSGLTTVLGFLAIATVPIDAIRQLGTFGALGVALVTASVVSLTPSLILSLGGSYPRPTLAVWLAEWAPRLAVGLRQRRREVVVGWTALAALCSLGISQLTVSTDIIRWFPHGTDVRDDYEVIRERLVGITPVQVFVESLGDRRVSEIDALTAISGLTQELRANPAVGKAVSIVDVLDQSASAVGVGWDDPGTSGAPEQYLLMVSHLQRVEDLLAPDHRSATVQLRLNDNRSSSIVELASSIDDWWKANGPPGFGAETTGLMFEFARSEEAIAYGQLRGLGVAALAIAAVLLITLRDLGRVVYALLPNLLPLGAAFGLMGALGVPLDAATVCLGSMALGIAVDDTIHVTARFAERSRQGDEALEATASSLAGAMPPVVLSSLIVALGFLVLGLSGFTLIRNLGLMTAGVVLVCLIADLTLLPALLARDRRVSGSGSERLKEEP